MHPKNPSGGQEKRGIRQTMRSGAKWLKDVARRPGPSPSGTPPLGSSEPSTASSFRPHDFSISRPTTPLSALAPPPPKFDQGVTPSSDIEAKHTAEQKTSDSAWSQLTHTLRTLENGVELFPPLKFAVSAFIGCLEIVEAAASNRADYEELAEEFQEVANMLNQYTSELELEPRNGSIANIAECIQHQVADIQQKETAGIAKRLLHATQGQDDVIQRYRRLERLFRQLHYDLSMRTRSDVKKQLELTLLQRISPVDDAKYNSSYSNTIRRHGCTAQTREAIHQTLRDWTTNSKGEKIYWMNGMAGTGKTTIAYSYCEWLKETNRLGGSFFCSRISSTCRSLVQIIPTLAYQLARYSPAFRSRLCSALNDDPDAGKLNVGQQFERLIQQPIIDVKEAIPDSVVMVIDALDECDDAYSVRLLLDVLLKLAEGLPLKFFVSSRPEPVIRDRMMSRGGSSRFIVYLHDIEQSIVEDDIKKYLIEALGSMDPPLTSGQIELLAKRSRNLFIYAATVVRYIYPDDTSIDSIARLESMLEATRLTKGKSSNRYEDLDLLYTTVLSAVFEKRLEEEEKDGMRRVLSTVVCAREPITTATIASLARLSERQVWSALQALRSVVHVPENSDLISTLHASFPEYMLDESRSKGFCCEESKSNETMAHRCLKVMGSELRFNICSLESSYLTDDKVQDLEDRVTRFISPALLYACRYWASHLSLAPVTSHTRDILLDFMSNRLLFWMEVLSLTRCTGIGASMMQHAQTWLRRMDNEQGEVQKQVSDARNFVTWFAANPCSRSTPHIYISALPLCAKSSWVYQCYFPRTKGLVGISFSQHEEAVLAIWGVESRVLSVAISPDANHIASGSQDGSVRIYNMHTGAVVAGPSKEHTDSVRSVVFSPSGAYIASGSNDSTVIVWDALTGRMVAGPLRKHTALVLSVAFSPDGTRIASGSGDRSIIVWDSSTGSIVLGPLEGHTNLIRSVAFSPCSQLIASGSIDCSIRLWDAQTGTMVAELKGHKHTVYQIAFSLDGHRLVSCSLDDVRLWDVKDRTTVGRPLVCSDVIISITFCSGDSQILCGEGRDITGRNTQTGSVTFGPLYGHTAVVKSVAITTDNDRIVSSADDNTIRIWDVQSKDRTSSRQRTDDFCVGPVIFLPNLAQFISNSSSGVLHIWDMRTGTTIPREFEGQTGLPTIHALAVSCQGELVSASTDVHIIQVWSVTTGKLVCQSLKGHKSPVGCLAFSPNASYLCSGSEDTTIIVWNIETGVMFDQPYQGHTGTVMSVAFSPDAAYIASGAADRTVKIWDSSTGVLLYTLNGHNDSVSSVAFSPNGRYIVSGSVDGAIQKWETEAGDSPDALLDPDHPSNPVSFSNSDRRGSIHWAGFSLDGTRIISGFGSSVRLFDSQSTELINKLSLPQGEKVRWVGYPADGNDIISISIPEQTETQGLAEDSTQQLSLSSNIVRVWRADVRPDQSSSSFAPRDWTYEPDGRVLSPKGLLMWIPSDLIRHMKAHIKVGSPSYYCPLVLSSDRSIDIGFADLCIGERWTDCYMHNT